MAQRKVVNDDIELCSRVKKFVYIFFETMDNKRDKLQFLYTSDQNPTMTWNGHHMDGIVAIRQFIGQLPRTDHKLTCIDAQLMNVPGCEDWAVVTNTGTLTIGNHTHSFTQCMILVPEQNSYHIRDDNYRFLD